MMNILRVLKANQVKRSDKPVFIEHNQVQEKPKEPDIDPNEDAFAAEAFQILSPEKLAGNGENIKTKPQADSEANESEVPQQEDDSKPSESGLSQAARKSRHAAVLERLTIKELELEAFEDELKEWQAKLEQQEQELIAKEKQLAQEHIKKRQDVEAECNQTLKMAKEAAESIKTTAQAEAEAIKKTAKIEVDSVRENAYKEGFEEGEAKGMAQGEAEGFKEIQIDWKNLMMESEMIIKELQSSRMGILKASEEEMLKLVIEFAKSVIKVEPVAQPDIILANIDKAINSISEVDKITMRVNIKDKAMCEAHKEQLISRLGGISELKIIEDPTLAPGGVKIETGVGTIDASLETQSRELEKAILNQFGRMQAE